MASKLAVLEDRRRLLRAEVSALVSRAETAPTPEATLAALQESAPRRAEIQAALADLDREIGLEALRREGERNAPAAGDDYAPSLLGGPPRVERRPAGGGRSYAAMFGTPRASDWTSFDEYIGTLESRMTDPRLVAASSHTTTIGSEGGFLVPDEFSAELLDGALEQEIVRPRAAVYPMTSGTRKISGFSAKDHTSGSIYGLTPVWLEEAGTAVDQKGEVARLTLSAHKLAIYASASNELAADGLTWEAQLEAAMRASTAFGLDTAFLTGSGAGMPRGVLNDPALVTVAKEAGQAADTILYDNLVKMLARLHPALLGESVWVANTTTIPQLSTMSVVVGTGGSHIPVMTRAGGGFEILTRPVVFTEKLPVIGDVGDIMLAAFSQYAIGLRKEVVLDRSNAPGWHEDESSYRIITRVDGQGRWTGPLTPLHGDTLSWCVVLAAR